MARHHQRARARSARLGEEREGVRIEPSGERPDALVLVNQIDVLKQLAFAVHAALDAGPPGEWAQGHAGDQLEVTPEATVLCEVLTARVASESEDEEDDRRKDNILPNGQFAGGPKTPSTAPAAIYLNDPRRWQQDLSRYSRRDH
jgi:hypothetical protein